LEVDSLNESFTAAIGCSFKKIFLYKKKIFFLHKKIILFLYKKKIFFVQEEDLGYPGNPGGPKISMDIIHGESYISNGVLDHFLAGGWPWIVLHIP